MSEQQLLIVSIILVLVVAFAITMLQVNLLSKKVFNANMKLTEHQNLLLKQTKELADELKVERCQTSALQQQLMDKEKTLLQLQRELQDQSAAADALTMLKRSTRGRSEDIKNTADMTDGELLAWIGGRMDETQLYTNPSLSLKDTAQALGLTQKRLAQLFRNHEKYANLGEYLTEKRFLLACELMRRERHWSIEAIAKEAGFMTRRTFQEVVKSQVGLTPSQLRLTLTNEHPPQHPGIDGADADGGNL